MNSIFYCFLLLFFSKEIRISGCLATKYHLCLVLLLKCQKVYQFRFLFPEDHSLIVYVCFRHIANIISCLFSSLFSIFIFFHVCISSYLYGSSSSCRMSVFKYLFIVAFCRNRVARFEIINTRLSAGLFVCFLLCSCCNFIGTPSLFHSVTHSL